MLLHCTLVRGPGAALQDQPVELTIDGQYGTPGAELQAALRARFSAGKVTVCGLPVSDLTIGAPPLANGAVLVDEADTGARRTRLRPEEPPATLALAVNSGPGAGLLIPLRRGTYIIGRSTADIVIPDPNLSRAHARLVVTETAITIEDLGSANGTEVDGERRRCAAVSTQSSIGCGNSTMSLVFLEQPGSPLDQAGRDVHQPLIVSRHQEPVNRAALVLTAVLPVILGVGLAVVTGMWMFLAFTAVSAASILVPVIGGRRQRRELAAAVHAAVSKDQERRRRAAPPLSALTVGGAGGKDKAAPYTGKGIWLRLGQAAQPANLCFDPPDPGRAVPSAGMLPVTLDPSRSFTSVRGPRDAVEGLVRSLLMQMTGYPLGRCTSVLVYGRADRLPYAARYLPGVTLSCQAEHLGTQMARGYGSSRSHGVLIFLGGGGETPAIISTALRHEWQVIQLQDGNGAPFTADVKLDKRMASFDTGTDCLRFVPDLAPAEVFDGFCRRLAKSAGNPGEPGDSIPLSCGLEAAVPASQDETARRWSVNSHLPGLAVPVGLGRDGAITLDLQTDGPHLLVAGTTGSGKSELLRSLAAALALSYPPDRINFLFVDFKGGSGLGPLTGLPHCVGMLTDLSSHELDRTLQSLRAEVRFREVALADVQAPDLKSYRSSPEGHAAPLPHLVVVIDEFRMLVEDAPEALSELMRIAAIGRSLGIHLVMATQRPQGALTADIRANVTTSVALRVQSETESLDIINSKEAAGISVDAPGRAYLARGTEPPVEFQACSLMAPAASSEPAGLRIFTAAQFINAAHVHGDEGPAGAKSTPAQAAAPLAASTSALWDAMGGAPVRKPVAAALPRVLSEPATAPERDSVSPGARSVVLGLLDLPLEQRTAPLSWEPALHGHVGLVGGPGSGAAEATGLAVHKIAVHPQESHLYILDPDSAFAGLASHRRVGARAGLHELRRAVRILERMAQEQTHRLAHTTAEATPLVLVISGWGSWASAFRAGPLAWAEDIVHDLVRDGSRAGITVIISGQRELVTSRFFAAIPNRVYFPAGSTEESRIAWPKLPQTAQVAGRGVAMGAMTGGRTAVCQVYTARSPGTDTTASLSAGTPAPATRPFRIEPLPALAPAVHILTDGDPSPRPVLASGRARDLFQVGVGGDELGPVSVRVPAGGVLSVLGGPSSGKSSFLRVLPLLNPDAGPWLQPDTLTEPAAYWSGLADQAAAGKLAKGSVALVDDADLLPYDVNRHLAELNALGTTVVMTAGYSPTLLQRVPLALQARNLGTGILIAPRNFLDGDLFGVRFEVEPNPPPGRSVVIQNGRAMAAQLGWAAPHATP